jgi:hypothetical protein
MDVRKHLSNYSAPIAEIAAINIAWLCGLSGFTSGLVTQNTGLALSGLALLFATLIYTVSRIYHLPRPSEDAVRPVHVRRQVADTFVWVDHLPRAVTGKQVS